MKTFAHLLVVAMFLVAEFAHAGDAPPITAKERALGYKERTILARPRADRQATAAAEEARDGVQTRKVFTRLDGLRVITLDAGDAPAQAIARLRATGRYEFVEPDYLKRRHAVPDDPRFVNGEQWYLRNTGQNSGTAGADIGVVAAWDVRTDSTAVIVAVIDTGVRATHEDLAENLWTNPGEIPGNSIDDDGNGYVDDVHGINSIAPLGSAASGRPDDDVGHGTYIAGLIGAAGNNGKGIAGVAWRAKIMALKFDDAEGASSVSNEVECIDYALAKGARIINISYGSSGYSQSEYDAIKRARDVGTIVVTSAGNDSFSNDLFPDYPANYQLDNLVAVAATDRRDALSTFSNYGVGVTELAAPGTAIIMTSNASDTAYSSHDGTSFSSPLVAGSLAMLKAQFPSDSYRGLINRLLRSVDPLPALAGKVQTGGRLNLARALTSTSNQPFNDDFAARAALSGEAMTLRSSAQNASNETGEPAHAGVAAGATLWWSWTAPHAGSAAVETTGSGFDTVVGVYSGSSLASLTGVASNDDFGGATTSRASFTAVAGATYQIAVGGKNGATGPVVLTIGYLPTNDQFANATTLTGRSARANGFNTISGSEAGEPKATTAARNRTVWYKWTAPISGYFSFSIFAYGFDAVGAVYRGSTLDSLVQIDTASTANYNDAAVVTAAAGTTYYFQVDSADGNGGFFDVEVVDALTLPLYYPANPSPVYNPVNGYMVALDSYGIFLLINANTDDVKSFELDGTLDVQSPAVGLDGSMYIGDDFGYLYAYGSNLSRRWKKDLGLVRVTSSPALGVDGTIYVHTDDGYLQSYLPDGTLKWRATVPGESYSSPSIGSGGTIYIGSEDQYLYALSPLDGSLKWKFKADGEIYASPAIDAIGSLDFGTLNGKFYSVSSTGVQRWMYDAGAPISSSAAIATDGTIYFGCYDYNLYALTSTGSLRWKYATGDEIRGSSPAIATDGSIYIGSYDGFVHAVTSAGAPKRTFATGAYIRSSPLIYDSTLLIGSGDTRVYVADIGLNAANSPWPMHRQNTRRTGRKSSASITAPTLLSPVTRIASTGAPTALTVNADGADTLTFQWLLNGASIAGATQSAYNISNISSAQSGGYAVVVTNSFGSVTSEAAIVGVSTTSKVVGSGVELQPVDIPHPNGNIFDQVLLNGPAETITADPGQVTRTSFIDPNDDIVQVEFTGAGTLSVVLDTPTGPAAPLNYTQAVNYMKGRASIVVTGANETTHLSVFSVGRLNAFDPTGGFNFLQAVSETNVPANNGSSLFVGHSTTLYDGVADIAYIAISSLDGKFGGLRASNASCAAAKGQTGIYAPGVEFTGPVFVSDIDASGTATPVFVIGSSSDTRITGGDLLQTNGQPVKVAGLTQLKFTAGGNSHGVAIDARVNRGVLKQNGVDVTAQIVVNPAP